MTDKFRMPTAVQAEKLVVKFPEGSKKAGQTNTPASIDAILRKIYPHSIGYADALAIIEKGGGKVKGDPKKAKTHPIRRIRWAMYRMARRGLATKVLGEPGDEVQWVITEEGLKVGEES